MRKFRPQAITRLRGFSEPTAQLIGENQIVLGRIEQLAWAEQYSRERRDQPHFAGAIGAVQNQYGVCDTSAGVSLRLAQRRIVQLHFRKRLATREFEIVRDEIAFDWRHSSER